MGGRTCIGDKFMYLRKLYTDVRLHEQMVVLLSRIPDIVIAKTLF